jgi:hypothetical protein
VTPLAAVALGYVARAALAAVLARRVPVLRPVAFGCVVMAALYPVSVWTPLWLRAGACVAWPGVPVAMALAGTKSPGQRPTAAPLVCSRPLDLGRRGRVKAGFASLFTHAEDLSYPGPLTLPARVAVVYLVAGIVAALTYVPLHAAYVLALLASRWAAVALTVWAVARPSPMSRALRLAHTIPAIGLACGVVAGAWPLVQLGGLAAVAHRWDLARWETGACLVLQALAMVWAARQSAFVSSNASKS